ncbi:MULTISPECIES: hypothetical protein [unclassified Wenzhouxiangella]|uniref:hypothetical protein n=1 Tax=unclassified Wenzhouxiangella TaxID=2613841 RepID=UPI000E3296E0|nr:MULTISPECIES: hypothetical protein [unclassified Wenzhouxiangella]RFF27867.1 hypothetical protein DZK25_05665 [Wenzhouxiangella sp. 15181]RFP69006.1 hypothetical protein DZK26_05800 [Wenzhouxiangella sp. 15190]
MVEIVPADQQGMLSCSGLWALFQRWRIIHRRIGCEVACHSKPLFSTRAVIGSPQLNAISSTWGSLQIIPFSAEKLSIGLFGNGLRKALLTHIVIVLSELAFDYEARRTI